MDRDWRADPVLRESLSYWVRRRAGRAMPQRRDIDPQDLRKFLPNLQLVEPVDGRFRYRLIGTAIVEAAGRDHTGKYLEETVASARAATVAIVYQQVCTERLPFFARSRYQTDKDIAIVANRLYLPLSEDGKAVSLILGALTFTFASELAAGGWATARLDPASQQVEAVDPDAAWLTPAADAV